ncbi:MAG TPA: 6,7-dimethyl-8-ribityllumazine synthase [Ignavibacteriaceae bacterium]|nr:6,7-dimethyl-8-ribityllumazine synthase [Ignavibacteriaceae bacterium]
MNILEGSRSPAGLKIAVIQSKYNEMIGERLLNGVTGCFKEYGLNEGCYDIIKVPGAFEIPLTADKLALQKKYDAIICIGSVIRGETAHFDLIASEVSKGIMKTSLKYGLPVIFGVLTTENVEQAVERSAPDSSNKGWEAALTAIEMADLLKKI